jgi:hypothetical protein
LLLLQLIFSFFYSNVGATAVVAKRW